MRAHSLDRSSGIVRPEDRPIKRVQSGVPAQASANRIAAIDAARGVAMILVCVSHMRIHFIDTAPSLYWMLTFVSRIATPTFLLLSGFIAAYVLSTNRAEVRIRLIDRGLCVLLIGHFALNLDELRDVDPLLWVFGRVTVTDAIGLCLMIAPLMQRLATRALAVLGILFAVLSWPVAMMFVPETTLGAYAGSALFAVSSEENTLIDAAIVPYLGTFLLGMALSKYTLADLQHQRSDVVARKLATYGIAALIAVGAGVLSWVGLKAAGMTPTDMHTADLLHRALDPRSKLPPAPAYLAFYGGTGLLIAATFLRARPRSVIEPIVRWTSTLGRASLMCFIVQDWLLRLLPALTGHEQKTSIAFWFAYLALTVWIMHWLAARWDAARANRFLTVGLRTRAASAT